MKDEIKKKFLGIKHKWIYFHIDSSEFQMLLDRISGMVHSNSIKSKDAINIVKCFKKQEKAFVKFIKTVGRKNFHCQCQIIDKDNNKFILDLTPQMVLDSHLLSNTPKALKLYKLNEKNKGNWKKPDDGFVDPVSYPPVEEELTELGYQMYKDWTEEVAASGMSSIDYIRKLRGIDKYYRSNK
tara:strand:+ start:592 stop:1140 length:549 start_codon:yes stop_codon:yes gene_type:complete